MLWKNSQNEFGVVSKSFHWLIAVLILAMLIVGFVMVGLPDTYRFRGTIYGLHKATGLCLLGLVVLRALWALANPIPSSMPNSPVWERILKHITHFLLYVVLFVMPLSGWAMSTAAGKFPSLFGWILVPMPGIPQSKELARAMAEVHEITAWVIIVLVSLHVMAVFKHHFINKDVVLKRMLF